MDPIREAERKVVEARFWSKVRKGDGCWEWAGSRNADGYGLFRMWPRGCRRAHRIAWELAHGPIPSGSHVLHRCDNPPCVRHDHLFLGTNEDNIRDRNSKRRQATGEQHGNCKLSDADARRILEDLSGLSNARVAQMFGVGMSTVQHLRSGETWKHVHAALLSEPPRVPGGEEG